MVDDEVNPLGTPTTNYGLTKPAVGADDDVWGGMLNTNFDVIDTTVKAVSTVANAAYPASNPAGYITAAAIPPSYVLPIATTSLLGGVKPDGTTITIDGTGKISGSSGYTLPTASTTVLGGVKVDGTTITISGGGVISGASSGGASVTVSDTAPSSPSAGALWYDSVGGQLYIFYNDGNSSQWVPVVNQGSASSSSSLIVKPPLAATWTQQNFGGTTTLTDVANGVALFDSSSAGVTNLVRGVYRAAPATPYVIDANLSALALLFGSSGNYHVFDVGWTDGTKIQSLGVYFLAGNPNPTIAVRTFATVSTAAAVTGNTYYYALDFASLWMRIADNGTNVTWSLGHDGVNFLQVYTIAKASGYLGASGYTNVGFFFEGGYLGTNSSGLVTLTSWRIH